MKIGDIRELVICDERECERIVPWAKAQEVVLIIKGNGGGREHYCREHRKPYDMHTTTSGWARYYTTNPHKEVYPYPIEAVELEI